MKRKDGAKLVEVEIGNNVCWWNGGVSCEPGGAEETFFFSREDAKEKAAGWSLVLEILG